MRQLKFMTALGLATALAVASPMQVLADTVKDGYDAKTWERLQDNTLEYDEISDLVTEYNPSFQMMKQGIAFNTAPYTGMVADMREEASTYQDLYKSAKDSGDSMLAKIYSQTAQAMRKEAGKMESSLKSQSRLKVNQTQKQLTSAIQSVMIMYNQNLSTKDLLTTVVELSQAAYESKQVQLSMGAATQADVQAAEKNLLDAKGNLQKVEDGLTTMRQKLCTMTGWSFDATPDIGGIPVPDLSRINDRNPEVDITKAISNNYALIDQRGGTTKGAVRTRTVAESEALIKTNLESAYQEVLQCKATYEAATSAFSSAQITMNGADLKQQLGMLGRLEYLSAQMAYKQQKAAYDQGSMGLLQAMETYDWMVEGLASME